MIAVVLFRTEHIRDQGYSKMYHNPHFICSLAGHKEQKTIAKLRVRYIFEHGCSRSRNAFVLSQLNDDLMVNSCNEHVIHCKREIGMESHHRLDTSLLFIHQIQRKPWFCGGSHRSKRPPLYSLIYWSVPIHLSVNSMLFHRQRERLFAPGTIPLLPLYSGYFLSSLLLFRIYRALKVQRSKFPRVPFDQ